MNTEIWTTHLQALFDELVSGSPDPRVNTAMLNRGDPGLLASLAEISAAAASAMPGGGASIAAHVDHLRYGLSLLNRRAVGDPAPVNEVDFTASWRRNAVSDSEWQRLRAELKREADAWSDALGTAREVSDMDARWLLGSIAHLAYHLGAIRQIDRATRGPTAEDEARVEAELRRP